MLAVCQTLKPLQAMIPVTLEHLEPKYYTSHKCCTEHFWLDRRKVSWKIVSLRDRKDRWAGGSDFGRIRISTSRRIGGRCQRNGQYKRIKSSCTVKGKIPVTRGPTESRETMTGWVAMVERSWKLKCLALFSAFRKKATSPLSAVSVEAWGRSPGRLTSSLLPLWLSLSMMFAGWSGIMPYQLQVHWLHASWLVVGFTPSTRRSLPNTVTSTVNILGFCGLIFFPFPTSRISRNDPTLSPYGKTKFFIRNWGRSGSGIPQLKRSVVHLFYPSWRGARNWNRPPQHPPQLLRLQQRPLDINAPVILRMHL